MTAAAVAVPAGGSPSPSVPTPTPALARRVVVLGVAVVELVLLGLNTGVYLIQRSSLDQAQTDLLEDRVRAVRVQAAQLAPGEGPADLARELQARGLLVAVHAPDGAVFRADPDAALLDALPPRPDAGVDHVSRRIALEGGLRAEVFARSTGVDSSLRRLLLVQVLGSLVALAAAALLLWRAAQVALRPLEQIARTARRTSGGERGARLDPDRPDTELGRLAVAYDEMLDTLEAGYQVAARLERRGGVLESQLRLVLDAAEAPYVAVAGDGTVRAWNKRAEELFGWCADEVIGRSAACLVPGRHRERFLREVARAAAASPDSSPGPYLLDGVKRDGQTFALECSVWAVERRGGEVVHSFVRDVEERRRVEDAVARLAAVVEGSSDAILTQSLDGTILSWNPAAERMYGWSATDAVGTSMSLIVPEDRRAELEGMLGLVQQGQRVAGIESERLTRGGSRVPVSLRVSPVHDAHGRVVAASSIARDVTEQRWMAETLDQALADLQQALEEARASEESSRRFLADAAHQLRTPMAGIRACAETLLRATPGDASDRLLATMVRETARAGRLVTSLLQIARIDQGEVGAQLEPVAVVALCAAEADRLDLLCPDLEVRLVVRGHPPARLLLDQAACQEVLSNLGDNARRHARTRVELVVDGDDEELRLRVRDDGDGVAPERREVVFERFVSLDGRGGSGLGLPVARGLARSVGGDVVYDDDGFVFRLPVRSADGAAVRTVEASA